MRTVRMHPSLSSLLRLFQRFNGSLTQTKVTAEITTLKCFNIRQTFGGCKLHRLCMGRACDPRSLEFVKDEFKNKRKKENI